MGIRNQESGEAYWIREMGQMAAVLLVFFADYSAGDLPGLLHEEQGGTQLPGLVQTGAQDQRVAFDQKAALVHKGGQIQFCGGVEILVKGGIECVKAAAQEQAAVVTAAGEHGGRTRGKILPAGMVG
jgi:hypothetical protein